MAKEYPDLKKINGATNVIDEIGRTSLKIASLIHEYTRLSFGRKSVSSSINVILLNGECLVGRAATFQMTDDMKSHIGQYQKICDDLQKKFDRRVVMEIMDTQRSTHELKKHRLDIYN